MKVTIEMNDEQAKIFQEAMDLYARIGMGQVEAIDSIGYLFRKNADWEDKGIAFEELRRVYFPDLVKNQHYGIKNEKTAAEARTAMDMFDVVRHAISWHKKPEGGGTVNFQDPTNLGSEPLIKIKISE